MSVSLFKTLAIVGASIAGLAADALAQEPIWMRGAVAVVRCDEGVRLTPLGADALAVEVDALPLYLPGLLTVETATAERVMLRASNGVLIDYQGAGYLSLERFEQFTKAEGEWLSGVEEPGQSRMIFNLRSGRLVLDQRQLVEASQLIVETPIGRIYAKKRALWMIEMFKDERKRTYSFNIHCVDGDVRLLDRMGRTFTIRSGQRLSGAGSSSTPSIEVAEMTSDAVESMEDFAFRVAGVSELTLEEAPMLAAMSLLEYRGEESPALPGERSAPKSAGERRPLVIEYAPRPQPVTAFQGLARPPSSYEADLF